MRNKFLEFMGLKEANESAKKATSEIKLSDDSDFKPFVVDAENHPNLRILIKAFLDSDKVALPGPDGYPQKLTTLDPAKGTTTPKLKKKAIYLVGGAVRDHLLGKTAKDYDLTTDATPDEIRLILRSHGFTEVKPQGGKSAPKSYDRHPEPGNKSKVFYAKGWDRGGKEYVICARINGEDFEIATFRKDAKGGDGRVPDKMEFGGLDDDSSRRDFTANAMYIPLTNPDGPNAKLIDPHGGAHHLRAGEVHWVGNAKERLEEDQLRALRYLRSISAWGKNTKIPEEVKSAIGDIKDLPSVSRERIREEFLKGLQHADIDPVQFVKSYKDLGLLNTVFPDLEFKLDLPEDFTDKKEKRLAIAWLLRKNTPAKIEKILRQGTWTNEEVRDIVTLVELSKWFSEHNKNPQLFFEKFYDMKRKLHKTGMVPSLIKTWGKMNNHLEDLVNKFLTHELDTKGFTEDPTGRKVINPKIVGLLGRTPQGEEFGDSIRHIETDKFRKSLMKQHED